jgi:hypothetical protein
MSLTAAFLPRFMGITINFGSFFDEGMIIFDGAPGQRLYISANVRCLTVASWIRRVQLSLPIKRIPIR